MNSILSKSSSWQSTGIALSDLDRRRISYLRLVLVLALVFLHYGGVYGSEYSPYRGYQGQEFPIASILISFVLYLGFTAVPAMSAISGLLFFRGATRDVAPDFMRKWRRRAVTLVLPFLLWSFGLAAVAYTAHLVEPGLFAPDFSTENRHPWHMLADALLGATRTPVAFQLWFIRDLIVTIAVSPIIWLLIGRAPRVTLASLAILWVADHDLWIFQRLDVLLFFCVGAACAMHGFRPDLPRRWILPVFILFLVVVMGRTVAPYFLGYAQGWGLEIATAAMRVLGALAVWNMASLVLDGAFAAWTQRNSYLAFFIHAAHYPPILFVKILLARIVNTETESGQIVLYGLTVAITISLCIVSGRLLQRWMPGAFRVLSGGRSSSSSAKRGGLLAA